MKSNKTPRTSLTAIALCAALLCGFLAGCGTKTPGKKDEPSQPPPAQDTGLVLNLYQPHMGQAALWEELAADYKNLTGVTVAIHTPKTTAAATELKEALKGERGAPGLFLFTSPREYKAWQDHAADLAAGTAYQHLIDSRYALTADGKTVGVPLGLEAFGIVCNTKVLDAYFALEGRDTEFSSMDDIKSYRELEELVKDIDGNKAALGIDGVFAAPALKEGESAAWGSRLLGVPLGYEIESRGMKVTGDEINEIELRHEAGYKGFHELHMGHMTTKEGLEKRAYADAVKEFATGKAAMILGGTDFTGQLNSAVGQTVAAEDCALLPAYMNIADVKSQGLAFETVLYAAVNGRAPEEERNAAEEFLGWLVTSEKGMDFLADKLSLLAPYDSVTDELLPRNPLAERAMEWLRRDGVKNTVTWSVLNPGEEFRDKVVGTGMAGYYKGETPWERFRDDLKEGWKKHRERADENY